MFIDAWLPLGFSPKKELLVQRCVAGEDFWQIYETTSKGKVLVANSVLANKWLADGFIQPGIMHEFNFGKSTYSLLEGGRGYRLEPVDEASPPDEYSECQAFVTSIAASRKIEPAVSFHDGIYIERLSRVLPCYTPAPATDDEVIAGFWMTAGVSVPLSAHRRIRSLVPWLEKDEILSLAAVLDTEIDSEVVLDGPTKPRTPKPKKKTVESDDSTMPSQGFQLPGRPALELFFNEHVVEIIRHKDRYEALGIHFPGAILLHGPPGCGKTFAIERLVEYLDWPSFSVDSGSIGSPYIHETGRKIAETFEQASKSSPSVVIIDEIDAFLAARDSNASGQHRVEEVAEFLRAIPKAAENKVLVIGMTNRLDSLDPAVVRRGRFDHIIEVGMPTEQEVLSLLVAKFETIPKEADLDLRTVAKTLIGRPLSDLGFIVREACRLAAKAGLSQVGDQHLQNAIASSPARSIEEQPKRKIGFV